MKKFLKYTVFVLVVSFVYVSLAVTFFMPDISVQPKYYSLSIKQNDHGWFYEIHAGDHMLIKQETIPAIAGNYHFIEKEDAEKIGAIVLSKVQQGIMPPTISKEEIESNNIRRRARKH